MQTANFEIWSRPHLCPEMSTAQPIVVYDSGVGGLSVARHLIRARPGDNLLYVADNAWFPYGNKTEERLRARIEYLIEAIANAAAPVGILVACNTASTAITESLKRDDVPVISVLPPVAQAVQAGGDGRIALLATPGTVFRRAVHEQIDAYAKQDQVLLIGALGLVHLAEEKLARGYLAKGKVERVLDPLITSRLRSTVRVVILGCTHFPLIKEELSPFFPNAEHWIDPAEYAIRNLLDRIPKHRGHRQMTTGHHGIRRVALTSDHNRAVLEKVFAGQGFLPSGPDWQFTTENARVKLKHLYPPF